MTKYGKEYKEEALGLVREIGVQASARRLGISPKTLYGWRQRSEESATTPDERSRRIRELERENTELRKANDILKRAMGFLAR